MASAVLPDYLTHYYETARGPLRSLSDLPPEQAEALLAEIRGECKAFASRRSPDYIQVRFEMEARIRSLFILKGGAPMKLHPHYFILGSCTWCQSWYERPQEIRLPLAELAPARVSFTYGDSFPAMRYQDGKAYRGQVYTLAELPGLVEEFGLPQDWNPEGKLAPERYIEAQVWDDQAVHNLLHAVFPKSPSPLPPHPFGCTPGVPKGRGNLAENGCVRAPGARTHPFSASSCNSLENYRSVE